MLTSSSSLLVTLLLLFHRNDAPPPPGHDDPGDHDYVLESPGDPSLDPRCNENNKNCRVSGASLSSVLQMFFCRSDMFCSSTTEREKKTFLADQISPYIDLSHTDLVEMDSCELVPLVNLVMYHRNNGLEMCKKNTTEQYRNLIIQQVLMSHLPVLLNWDNVGGAKLLSELNNMMLVSFGCHLENLEAIQENTKNLGNLVGATYLTGGDRDARTWPWEKSVDCGDGDTVTHTCQYCPKYHNKCAGECYLVDGDCKRRTHPWSKRTVDCGNGDTAGSCQECPGTHDGKCSGDCYYSEGGGECLPNVPPMVEEESPGTDQV